MLRSPALPCTVDGVADTPALDRLDELIETLQHVRKTDSPIDRARLARSLDRQIRAVLGRVGDEAVFLAANELVGTRRRTHQEIGDALGVSRYRVSNAISDYRAWAGGGAK